MMHFSGKHFIEDTQQLKALLFTYTLSLHGVRAKGMAF